jgi:hypothetical protein
LRKDISKLSPVASYTRPDGDYPVAWAKMYGKGRVFYSSIGNGQAAEWDDNNLLRMYFEALKWSLGLTQYELKPTPYRQTRGRLKDLRRLPGRPRRAARAPGKALPRARRLRAENLIRSTAMRTRRSCPCTAWKWSHAVPRR